MSEQRPPFSNSLTLLLGDQASRLVLTSLTAPSPTASAWLPVPGWPFPCRCSSRCPSGPFHHKPSHCSPGFPSRREAEDPAPFSGLQHVHRPLNILLLVSPEVSQTGLPASRENCSSSCSPHLCGWQQFSPNSQDTRKPFRLFTSSESPHPVKPTSTFSLSSWHRRSLSALAPVWLPDTTRNPLPSTLSATRGNLLNFKSTI